MNGGAEMITEATGEPIFSPVYRAFPPQMGSKPALAGLVRKSSFHCLPPRRAGFNRLGLLALLAGVSLLTGCGYSSGGLYRQGVQTVYVEMFQTREFRREIEFQVTEAIRKQIDRSTPYRNAESKEKADTILSGEVLEWREATLGRSFETGLPRETAGTLVIRYRWQDMRTGKLLVEQPRLVTTVQFVPPAGETVFTGRYQAADQIARLVVESMAASW